MKRLDWFSDSKSQKVTSVKVHAHDFLILDANHQHLLVLMDHVPACLGAVCTFRKTAPLGG